MNRKIVVMTTDGDSREDFNVFYSLYLLVEHPHLTFSESIFQDELTPLNSKAFCDAVRALGYTVYDDIENVILTLSVSNEDDTPEEVTGYIRPLNADLIEQRAKLLQATQGEINVDDINRVTEVEKIVAKLDKK